MPPRRPHAKSRLGCKQCKQRRIKCDEKGPICYNCERRGFDCSFKYSGAPLRPPNPFGSLERDSKSASGQDATPSNVSWSSQTSHGAFTRVTELELMHHYSTATYSTFLVRRPEDEQRMKIEVVDWGLTHGFLLDSLFALTALHIASMRPNEVCRYGDLAAAYQDRALARFQELIRDPKPEQCPALFYVSALVGVLAFALPRIHPTINDNGPTATLVHMARLFKGTFALVDISKELVGAEKWDAIFPEDPRKNCAEIDSDIVSVVETVKTWAREADQLSNRESPSKITEPLYLKPVEDIHKFFSTVADDPPSILGWAVEIGSEFTTRLESGDPLAQIITLVYAVLLHQLDGFWWAAGAAKDLVDELSGPVAAQSLEWANIVTWAIQKVSQKPTLMKPLPQSASDLKDPSHMRT